MRSPFATTGLQYPQDCRGVIGISMVDELVPDGPVLVVIPVCRFTPAHCDRENADSQCEH